MPMPTDPALTPPRRLPALLTDTLLAAAGVAANLTQPRPTGTGTLHTLDAAQALLAVGIGGALALNRRWPLTTLIAVLTAVSALQAGHYVPPLVNANGLAQVGVSYSTAGLTAFLAALRTSRRAAPAIPAAIIPAAALAELIITPHHGLASAITGALILLTAWALGRLVNSRRTRHKDILERLAAVARAEAATARAAIADERARIARELHDIVAHNVSLMVVQAIAADRIQDRDPAKAHELHKTIEETGRTAVAELRTLLHLLRTDDEPATTPPQPGTAQIPELIETVQNAGLTVSYTMRGTPRPLPAGTELAIYRVAQEALTNTLKHAGRTTVDFALHWQHHQVSVKVCDQGRPGTLGSPAATTRAGHGLLGMRERVAILGGTLHTSPRPQGGYCVHASIPLPTPSPA
ncbi:histidine kinase [Streptomyces sp. NPDC094149]|uniref:sensor histidine kinase n=1 Tax=Streptomyces sp. NPDC094149 TaxID=3155079 RepID=UPI003322DD26